MPLEVVKTHISIKQEGDASTFGTMLDIANVQGVSYLRLLVLLHRILVFRVQAFWWWISACGS